MSTAAPIEAPEHQEALAINSGQIKGLAEAARSSRPLIVDGRLYHAALVAPDPMSAVVVHRDLSLAADAAFHEAVARCRSAGYTWAEIGGALGVSRQAAWERFSKQVP